MIFSRKFLCNADWWLAVHPLLSRNHFVMKISILLQYAWERKMHATHDACNAQRISFFPLDSFDPNFGPWIIPCPRTQPGNTLFNVWLFHTKRVAASRLRAFELEKLVRLYRTANSISSLSLSVCLSVCLSLCLFVFISQILQIDGLKDKFSHLPISSGGSDWDKSFALSSDFDGPSNVLKRKTNSSSSFFWYHNRLKSWRMDGRTDGQTDGSNTSSSTLCWIPLETYKIGKWILPHLLFTPIPKTDEQKDPVCLP